MKTLRLGTRGSRLALFQARLVADGIRNAGGPASEIVVIKTSGDRLADAALAEAGGKRLFVKEIEDALSDGAVDLAVHSSKDMPADLPSGLVIGAVLPREDAADVLVLPSGISGGDSLEQLGALLGEQPRIGTGSVRRMAQLRRLFPGARFQNIRGNLDTRLRKLDAGEHDLLVLAAAGLRRLGFASRISMALPVAVCIPAPGQGIIAIETRVEDDDVAAVVARVGDAEAAAALDAERALVSALGGGCQMPIGAVALPGPGGLLDLHAIVTSLDGERIVRERQTGLRGKATALGQDVARRLLAAGAAEILSDAQGVRPVGEH